MRGVNHKTTGRYAAGKAVFRGTAFLFRAACAVCLLVSPGLNTGARLKAQTVDPYAHIKPVDVAESRYDSVI